MAYVGLARAFRGRIEAAVTVAIKIVRDTSQQLIARQRRHPVQRRDTLASIARAWRDKVPAFGRANQEIRLEGKEADWDEDAREPGLSVVRITPAIAPHEKLALGMHMLCAASLHALARRYQRGRPTTDDAIIADLHALAAAHERLRGLPEGDGFAVDVASGQWLGNALDVRSHYSGRVERVPNVRTFVET